MNILKVYRNTFISMSRVNDCVCYKKTDVEKWYRKIALKTSKEKKVTTEEEIERVSISRTKRRIKDICLSNDFEYFITCTVNCESADRFSLLECQTKLIKIMQKIRRKQKDALFAEFLLKGLDKDIIKLIFKENDILFKYIFVTEKHENGAFHFHGMIKNVPVEQVIDFNDDLKQGKKLPYYILDKLSEGIPLYHLKLFDELGNNVVEPIHTYNRACSYMVKYMLKDYVKSAENQIFFCSKGLTRPSVYIYPDEDLSKIFGKKFVYNKETGERVEVDDFYQNDFCQKRDIDLEVENNKKILSLMNYLDNNEKYVKYDNNITNWLKLLTSVKNRYNMLLH